MASPTLDRPGATGPQPELCTSPPKVHWELMAFIVAGPHEIPQPQPSCVSSAWGFYPILNPLFLDKSAAIHRDQIQHMMSHEELTKSHKIVLAYMETSKTPTTCNQESDHKTVDRILDKIGLETSFRYRERLVQSGAWGQSLRWDKIRPRDQRQIQVFACLIWHGLLNWKAAPPKWGDAPMDVQEHYYYDMEVKFEILRYCEGHWKAQAVATLIYSQWHSTFVKKCGIAVKEEGGAEPDTETAQATSTKRPRLASSDDVSELPSLQKNIAGSMPKGITPIDPLADVFDDLSASGFLFGMVPDVIPTLTLDPGTNGDHHWKEGREEVCLQKKDDTRRCQECKEHLCQGLVYGVFPILKGPKGTLPDIGTLWRQVLRQCSNRRRSMRRPQQRQWSPNRRKHTTQGTTCTCQQGAVSS
ncbi:hypothetical protein EDB83DRAFT_2320835 [Lactarius deliciosus]|nr:hypothetical protein EDB83DRAFT_2320835 [Lactarius deliciosus]